MPRPEPLGRLGDLGADETGQEEAGRSQLRGGTRSGAGAARAGLRMGSGRRTSSLVRERTVTR